MLAAFATPGQKKPPARDIDGLEDDVATLSYERALRAHARYRSPEASDHALTQPYKGERVQAEEPAVPDDAPAATPRTQQVSAFSQLEPESQTGPQPEFAHADSAYERSLKSASITIRLSKAECVQLRQRAAEAGLTISAYLRSCTVEAESLRAQVKETLAQLRAENARENPAGAVSARASWLVWLRMLWPFTFGDKQAPGSKRAVLRARLS
jgi:predicted DNA binding CopG/RHH family protein